MRSIYATALITYRECVRDPAYTIIVLVFAALIVLGSVLAMFSFTRQNEMVCEMSLSSLMLGGLVVAMVVGAGTIVEDRHARTALPTLAKPVSRKRLVAGRYCGIMAAVALAMFVLWCVVVGVLWFKIGTETMTGGGEMITVFPVELAKAGVLAFCEIAFLGAVLTALSLFFSRLVTIGLGLALLIGGHLVGELRRVLGVADDTALGAVLQRLPNLEFYRVTTQVAERQLAVGSGYMAWAAVYTLCGAALVLLVSMILYEKREIN